MRDKKKRHRNKQLTNGQMKEAKKKIVEAIRGSIKSDHQCANITTFFEMVNLHHGNGFHPFVVLFRADTDESDESGKFRTEDYIFCSVEDEHVISRALEAALKMFTGSAIDEGTIKDVIN